MEGGAMNFNEVEPEMVCAVDPALITYIEQHFEELDRRSNRLARALRHMHVNEDVTVAIVVCDDTERLVALTAVRKLGAGVAEIPCELSPVEFANSYRASGATLTLAGIEGSQTWLSSGVGGLILGDGEGVIWWKLAELRESSESLID
jgi:acyl-coenzyme A synthetase/AMP-(fatty) acid ligase